jgi:hypothetical protein
MVAEETVRELLRTVWMQQACMRPTDRDRVFDALMKDSSPPADGTTRYKRASLRPSFDSAVDTLVRAFANGPPADPIGTVWRAFPRLDKQHREKLAELLIAARTQRGIFDE